MHAIAETSPDALRARMGDLIAADSHIRVGPAVEAAMRTVERHRFLPAASVEEAYANRS